MNLTPISHMKNIGLVLGGQASAWQKNLADYTHDTYITTELTKLIDAAYTRTAPFARELSQIVPGALPRLRALIAGSETITDGIDNEPAISVPGILLSHIASIAQLAQLGLDTVNTDFYGHSQAAITLDALPYGSSRRELTGTWANDTVLVDHLAFAFLLGAATSQHGFGRMLAVRGVPTSLIDVPLAVINGPDRVVLSGSTDELNQYRRRIEEIVATHNARITNHDIGGVELEAHFEDLGVNAAFHHKAQKEAAEQAIYWSEQLGLAVAARTLAENILLNSFLWEVGNHDYLLALDPSLARITEKITDAVIVPAYTPALRDDLGTPGHEIGSPVDYSAFAPQLITLPDGETKVQTAFSKLTGNSPILLAGMTPTTVDADIVAAAANAGYWAEMAGGGQYSEEVFNFNNTNLQKQLEPGRSAQFNSMFFDRYMWNLQFGQQRIVSKARAAGSAINGVTISAGIPELEEASQLIKDLRRDGYPFIAFKPGTVAQIYSVLDIAQANPEQEIIMQVEDGHAGGHHSWVDLDQLLLSTYKDIRHHRNVVLVVGGGIGTPEKAAAYITGSWARSYGHKNMPVDGILVGTAAMACKEAKTTPAVKQILVNTPGVAADDEGGWVGRLKTKGGMTSGQSHLLADLYEIDTDFAKASRLITSLDPDTYIEHREEIIEALSTTAKPYFGDVDTMTYAEWVQRFVELAYPFTDPTWDDRFLDLLRRVEARLHKHDHGHIPTLFADVDAVANAPQAVEKLLAAYPLATEITVSPRDAAWFIQLNRKHHKPMPWVPIIDGDLKRWFGLDSLWQAHDERYPANAVRIIPGPVSVGGITKINEPIAELLGRFEAACVAALSNDETTQSVAVYSRIGASAEETIRNARTISWHGHLIANPAHDLAPEAYELLPSDEDNTYILRILADTFWENLPEQQRPYYVKHVDIPLELPPSVATGASPVVSETKLSDAVFALLAGVAGVGSTSAAGDVINALPHVDDTGLVHDSFHLPQQLLHTHAGVSSGNTREITPDVLVGPCWPAIYTALGTGRLHDGYPVIEGLLNAVHLDHLVSLEIPLADLATGERIEVTSQCESIKESVSGRIVTVVLKLTRDGQQVATLTERFAIRGRATTADLPELAPEYGGSTAKITATPRSFIDRVVVHAPADMTPFATVTGDYNPIHTSYNAAQLVGLPAPLVHGMWLSATSQQVAGRYGNVESWTYSMYGMVQLNDEVEITVERVGRAGLNAALEVTCRIGGEVVSRGQALIATPYTAYVYPGQGIQTAGMGQGDRQSCPRARAVWQRADNHTRTHLGFSIIDVVDLNPTTLQVRAAAGNDYTATTFRHPAGVLNLTQFTQVALAVVAYGQTERLRAADALTENSMYAGHSLGEYTALASLGNIFGLEAVIDIVFSRGSAMHTLVPRDEQGRSNYGLGALRPNMIGIPADQVEEYVAKVAHDSNEYLEIVNYNIAGQQYSVAGTLAGLAALQAATNHPKAFVMIPGIDVPFHSSVLRPGVPAFAAKLDELLPHDIDTSALVGRYIPNLVARPFELSDAFIQAICQVVPATNLEQLNIADFSEKELARILLIELLSWQFASPVRWIETQELIITQVDQIVEVGLASSPTLTNLALRSMDVLGTEIPVLNVERDMQRVVLEDVTTAPVVDDDEPDSESAEVTPPDSDVAEVSAAPAEPLPAAAEKPQAHAGSGNTTELSFDAAAAIDVLFAFQNKIRIEQITPVDTTEILTGGVSSRRNQLLMDMSAEIGVAAIDGAADAEVQVLRGRVNTAAPTYQAFGPVLGEAINARLRQLAGAAGLKPNAVGEYVTNIWCLPQSWVPHVEAEILLATREGDSVRGGALGNLPQSISNKAQFNELIDAAIQLVADRVGVSVSRGSSGAGSSGAVVDSAALGEFADKITGADGVLAKTARTILHELGHTTVVDTSDKEDYSALFAAMDAELGTGWLQLVTPAFDAERAILFDDRWASAKEDLARIALGEIDMDPQRFIGLGEVIAGQAQWWYATTNKPVLTEIAHAAKTQAELPYAEDIAVVTGAAPGSIATAIVEKLLAGGATVVMTASRVDQKRKEFARQLFSENAAGDAALWIVSANLNSFRDVDALMDWIGAEQKVSVGGTTTVTKPALIPTLLFPFAAPPVHGLATDAGPEAENQARLLLWSVERMVGKAAALQDMDRVHVVLPGSPNRGRFGGDGAYGEVKAGLDALVNKWSAESGWPEKVSFAHAHIGWVAGTNLMGANDALVPLAKEAGIQIYTPAEITEELLGLISPTARAQAAQAPLLADFTGGLATTTVSLSDLATQAAAATSAATTPVAEPISIKALPTPSWPTQAPAITTDPISATLDDLVVIVGIGEVSSWGSGRTRFEAEYGIQRDGSVDLTAAGVLELAWMTGLINWLEDPTPGWYDADGVAIAEEDIFDRYRDEVVARCGVRRLSDKYFLTDAGSIDVASVYLNQDIEFTVTSEAEARDFLAADPEGTTIAATDDGEWLVRKAQGSIARIPKRATLTRSVAGQMPDNFDPAKWGIPAHMIEGLDRIAVWNLVTAVDAFLTAGFSPAELLQAVHPGNISSTQGTGVGGMESLHKMFVSRFLGEERPSDILQEALPNVVAAHVMQSYIGGYGQMIHPVGACATAAVSVEEGVDKIALGKADVVIAGGIDDVQVESLTGFGDMNATAETAAMLAKGIDPRFISRANDRRRAGFLEAEGGGTVILARGTVAKELGLPVYAVIAHAQSYADGAHTSIPAPGIGALGAARGGKDSRLAASLRRLGLTPDDVRVVSKHDTSTNANDPNESELHTRLWPAIGRDKHNPLFVISQKSLTGHAKGGAALFQIGGLIDVFTHGRLPQNASLDCVDKEIKDKADPLVWLRSPLDIGEVKAGVLTSLGFGHVAAVVVLAHPGIFATLAGEQWRERASKRLRAGAQALERGMIARGELYVAPKDRRLPVKDAHLAEINLVLNDDVRLGEDGVYPQG
ncbi:type I polyketide synthase [Corynebacterium kutscheri]|uniref:Fatty-acid synthase I n=1 Tax=Corynebacterium kutscheri TaxID=35755 RepID=A0AB38VRT9_9CORY|nr:type I polyketide synthase [Corynebacterium kutscheri]VEH06240.1 fatty-acid synthase I [Corynebacterium kutscheri]